MKEVLEDNIDVSNLSPGLYFLEVMIDGQRATKKFIVK